MGRRQDNVAPISSPEVFVTAWIAKRGSKEF